MENNYQKPFYELEIKAFMCSFKIEINGIPTFCSYENEQIATDWPINMFIIESGKQSLTYQILPLNEKDILSTEAYLELNIYVRESDGFYLDKQKINQFIFIADKEEQYKTISQTHFNADVPFELDNYLDHSVDLTNFNGDKLKDELWIQYQKMFGIISTRNNNKYNSLTENRFKVMEKAFYLDEIKKNYYSENPFKIFKDYDLAAASKDEYEIETYGNGYLCALKLKNQTPGLCIYISENQVKKEIVIESAIFYLDKNKNYILYR